MAIPKECKRLAEVDFPIAVVSRHSVEEKSIRQGLPSTLHLWWARRPLAACRAMLLALLLPDPCDEKCPIDFKEEARRLLRRLVNAPLEPGDAELQKALLNFIGDFANWDNASRPAYLETGRSLVKASHGSEAPLVADPFAGGGSIPLEAVRLGCDAFAGDLNPVACLILQTMLEDMSRQGVELTDQFRRAGLELKKQAETDLARYFPPEPKGAAPIAYLWARTVNCESPNCGAEIPLTRSFWLCKKASRLRALRAKVLKPQKGGKPLIELEIFAPKSGKEVTAGSVSRAKATCLACERVLAPERVRAQLRTQRGGADTIFDANGNRIGGARILSVVTLGDNVAGRQYRLASDRDYLPIWEAQKAVAKLANEKLANGLNFVPDEPLPPQGTLGFRVQLYGMLQWGDLFTARQKLAFLILTRTVRQFGQDRSASAACQLLAMVCSKLADRCNGVVNWSVGVECPTNYLKARHCQWVGISARATFFLIQADPSNSLSRVYAGAWHRCAYRERTPRQSNSPMLARLRFQMNQPLFGSPILRTTTRFRTLISRTSFSSGSRGLCQITRFCAIRSIGRTLLPLRSARLFKTR